MNVHTTDRPDAWPTTNEDAQPRQSLVFPNGLPGFANLRRFWLVSDPLFTPPFELLTSEEEPEIGFYLIDPRIVDASYDPDLPAADEQALQIGPADEILLRAVVTVGDEPTSTTANLGAPLALNLTVGIGIQSILEDTRFSFRAPLIHANASKEAAGGTE